LDITEGDETSVGLTTPLFDDLMSTRSLDDLKRALGESAANGEDLRYSACAPERLLRIFSHTDEKGQEPPPLPREDQLKNRLLAETIYTRVGSGVMSVQDTVSLAKHLSIGFPLALRDDQCWTTIACAPKDACKADNTCSEAYKHTELKCNAWQEDNPTMNRCNMTLQCVGRQSGEACMAAMPGICNCPQEWETGSFACSKKCVREQKEQLTQAGCNVNQLIAALARQPPKSTEFMNGAVCHRDTNSSDGEGGEGFCKCVPSHRCALCTSGTHYRVQGECIPCPQNPGLIIVGAVLGIFFLCIGMRELDKRQFNLAFVSIGWDYFQVLALFADADIQWPQLLQDMFRMLAFFNIGKQPTASRTST
jgi:hypothetical protein